MTWLKIVCTPNRQRTASRSWQWIPNIRTFVSMEKIWPFCWDDLACSSRKLSYQRDGVGRKSPERHSGGCNWGKIIARQAKRRTSRQKRQRRRPLSYHIHYSFGSGDGTWPDTIRRIGQSPLLSARKPSRKELHFHSFGLWMWRRRQIGGNISSIDQVNGATCRPIKLVETKTIPRNVMRANDDRRTTSLVTFAVYL